MKTIELNDVTYELKYTFNSMMYMKDFNLDDIQNMGSTPFKIAEVCEILLLGALNNNPKIRISQVEVDNYLNDFVENEGDITQLAEDLMDLLKESAFFKSLLKKKPAKAKK